MSLEVAKVAVQPLGVSRPMPESFFSHGGAFCAGVATKQERQGCYHAERDFNQDGKADILWRNENSGELAFWRMNGVQLIDGVIQPGIPQDLAWRVVATGDFDRDGKTDLLWEHAGSTQLAIWYLNGVTLREGTMVVPPQQGCA